MQPNDLPLVCLPTELSGEAAAQLVEFLYQLIEALESHYYAQIREHYRQPIVGPRDRGCSGPLDDPPF